MSKNRTFTLVAIAVVAVAILVITPPAEAQRRAGGQIGANCVGGFQALFEEIDVVPMTSGDEADLIYLREEEKLARDVYLTLADRWELPIFRNIAEAEQRHMDLVFKVIELYGLTDPVVDDAVGAFSDPFFEQLYYDLINMNSPAEPELTVDLTVGAMIEDMDLRDLYDIIEYTDDDHLKLVAYNLAKGSRNHLRAFMRALTAQGATYDRENLDPSLYLDQEDFDAILEANMEQRVFYNADGEPVPACGAAVGGFGMRRGYRGQGDGGRGDGGHGDGSRGDGSGTGTGECDGTGPHGNGSGDRTGTGGGNGTGSGTGTCDGSGNGG